MALFQKLSQFFRVCPGKFPFKVCKDPLKGFFRGSIISFASKTVIPLVRKPVACDAPAVFFSVFGFLVFKIHRLHIALHLESGDDRFEPGLTAFSLTEDGFQPFGEGGAVLCEVVDDLFVFTGREAVVKTRVKIVAVPAVI